MEQWLGNSWGVFLGITCFVIGFAAFMTGQALANTWKPLWHVFVYCLLLGCAARFLSFALFDGVLLSASGYFIDCCVLIGIALVAFKATQARKMVSQYPWLYRRSGWFRWQRVTDRAQDIGDDS